MRLGFDASSLHPGGKGLARFQGEFLRALAELALVEEVVVFAPEHADHSGLPRAAGWTVVPVRTSPMLWWEQAGMPLAARAASVDVTLTTSERSALWGPPNVVYIFEHPRHRTQRARQTGTSIRQRVVDGITLGLLPLSLSRARAVVTASRATAADLPAGVSASVVPSAASAEFYPDSARAAAARGEFDAPDGYFLHVASDDPRDNSAVVLEALALLARTGARPKLVIGGPVRAMRAPLELRARELGVEAQISFAGFRPADSFVDLYRGALAYVDPSLYEGFGLQALEALACGVPAVASGTTSLPEVVGDAGFLLDPNDVAGFATAMGRLLREPGLRAELSQRAIAQAARFSWERTVRQTLDVVRAAVGAAPATGSTRPTLP